MVRATAYLRTLRTSGAPRGVDVSKKQILGGLGSSPALDAVAAPRARWLKPAAGYELVDPPSPATLACKQSGPITGAAWRSHRGRAGDGADPSRTPGRSVPLGLAPPRHPFVGCRRSVKRAASLPKSRCAPHWESPRRAARPDGSEHHNVEFLFRGPLPEKCLAGRQINSISFNKVDSSQFISVIFSFNTPHFLR